MSVSECNQIAGFAACVGFFVGIGFVWFMRLVIRRGEG